jgi:hypothetical protein
VASKNNGTVVAWGLDEAGQTEVPAGLSGVVQVAAGGYHSVAVRGNGTVVAWGENDFGQVSLPAGLSSVTSVAAGWSHNVALQGTLAQPDSLVSRKKSGGYVGNDIYNRTGAWQTTRATARRAQTRTFYVQVGNDGTSRGAFTVTGTAPAAGARVRYHAGPTDITRAMRGGGWEVNLRPAASRTIRVTIKITKAAGIGKRKVAGVSASWNADPTRGDTVKAVVEVVR